MGGRYENSLKDAFLFILNGSNVVCNHRMLPNLQDVFDLPFHMARDQIEESLRTKMSSIKVFSFISLLCWSIDQLLCQQMKILVSDKLQNLSSTSCGSELCDHSHL